MINKRVRINCYKTTYEVEVADIQKDGIIGTYSGVSLDPKSKKYKKLWTQNTNGRFLFDSITSLKVLN
jgi:hypothetical protein